MILANERLLSLDGEEAGFMREEGTSSFGSYIESVSSREVHWFCCQ
jgi:hypothetical protein